MALCSCAPTYSQEQPLVRVDAQPDVVAVGQPVKLRVTVLVPTWFAVPPVYPAFELAGAMTQLPADSSFPTSERIQGQTWSGIVRDYQVFPLVGATYVMTGQNMRVAYADPGKDPIVTNVAVPDVTFRSTVPAGAEQLDPYVAGGKLDLQVVVDGSTDGLKAGDAVVLSYAAELDGLPAIFLPPLAPSIELEGVAVYKEQPIVDDGPPARRTEKLTLVFEGGGEFSLPAVELEYWNTDSGAVETVSADTLHFTVAGPPLPSSNKMSEPIDRRKVALFAAMLLAILTLTRYLLPIAIKKRKEAALRRRESEQYAFQVLRKALRSGKPEASYAALLDWLGHLSPAMESQDFALQYGDAELYEELSALSEGLFASGVDYSNFRVLGNRLGHARKGYLLRLHEADVMALPALNP